jgi:molecular chaperone GrpE
MLDESNPGEGDILSGNPAEFDRLTIEVSELKERSDRLLSNWQRAQSDLQNFRRQTLQAQEETVLKANIAVLMSLLPVLDDLERATQSIPAELHSYSWMDGIWIIHKRLLAVMTAFGLEPIESEGEDFNPNLHQSVAESLGEDGKVIVEIQKGYTLQKRLLRPALVTVGKEIPKDLSKADASVTEPGSSSP